MSKLKVIKSGKRINSVSGVTNLLLNYTVYFIYAVLHTSLCSCNNPFVYG